MIQPIFTSSGSGMPATVEKRGIGTMRVAMAAQHEGRDVFDAHVQFLGEEVAEARAVEHARHADDLVVRQAGELAQRPHHRVERIGDADDEGVRRVLP